jgi:hypothetical protein
MMNVLKCLILLSFLALCGCGGSASEYAGKTVSGNVVFPVAMAKPANKTDAAPTLPALTITDLGGNIIATPPLIAMSGAAPRFSFSADIPAGNDYVISANWGSQVLKALADVSSLDVSSPNFVVDAASTATVMVLEQKLKIPSGSFGTAGSATVQSNTLAGLSPATLQVFVGTNPICSALLGAVTGALTSGSDPATVPSVIALASNMAGWTYSGPTVHGAFTINQNMTLPTADIATLSTDQLIALQLAAIYPLQSTNRPDSIAVTTDISGVPLTTGIAQHFTAMGVYGTSTKDLTTSVTWSSSNTSVATISSGGVATTLAAGTTTITATLGDVVGTTTLVIVIDRPILTSLSITEIQSLLH